MTGSYDLWLVALSVGTGIVVSYVALALTAHVRLASGFAAGLWIGGGALSMGLGIWAMHFVGMLAFSLPIVLVYDIPRTLGSMVPAVVAAAVALNVVRWKGFGPVQAAFGGTIMGLGISAMHYLGMDAIQVFPGIVYDPLLVTLSILLAIVASTAALWLTFRFEPGPLLNWRKSAGAVGMGVAIASMHYTGMAAAGFPADCVSTASPWGIDPRLLAVLIGLAAFAVVALTMLAVTVDLRLGERNAAMVAELRRQKERAEAASRTKSEFLANVSHELRTPLNAIIGFSDVIRSATFGPLGNERYEGYVENINDAGRHLLALIDDILDVSVIEAGRLTLSEEPVDVGGTVASAVALVRPRAEQGGVTLLCRIAPRMPFFVADSRRFRQVVLNLTSNAVKFTPPEGAVCISAEAVDGRLVLRVADTGIGMDAEGVAQALQPFGQVENILSRRREGVGLGLPLSKALVEAHGGVLTIDSMPGRGTTVTIELPASRMVPRAAAPQPAEPAAVPFATGVPV